MKKLLLLILLGSFFFVFQTPNLFADDFSDCLDLERLKAKSDGVDNKKSIEQAERICKLKFNREGDSKKDSANSKKSTSKKNTEAKSGTRRAKFSLDFLFGSKQVKNVGENCEQNGEDAYPANACDRHPASALLLDFFLTPQFSITFGSLSSVYKYPKTFRNVDSDFVTSEVSLGGRLHLKKSSRSGWDFFVGAGSVDVEGCNKHEIENRNGSITRVNSCAKRETGSFAEGGVKYVANAGFSIGYYLRSSSTENYGGDTRGLTLGWTW